MLQRVDQVFHRISEFNADIALELRTPIANLMTQTQVVLSRERTIDKYREILYSNMEEYERMAQMAGDMLFLAQAENSPREITGADLDLAREMRTLFDYYEGWAEERGVSLTLDGAATVSGGSGGWCVQERRCSCHCSTSP
ncbi:MAG: histidine kinase dimerization/phospho-acceptor domain-containing protein [Gammaproteobacteria bacterium]